MTLLACGGSSDDSVPASSSPGSSGEQPAQPGPLPSETPAPAPAAAATTYFPPAGDAWENLDATALATHFDSAKLDELTQFAEQSKSTTFMVLYDGRIVVEKYSAGSSVSTLRDVASAQKSVISLMVGAAVARGLLAVDDKVTSILGDGWSNGTPSEEAPITVRHLLTMTSGLDESLHRVADPGTQWLYKRMRSIGSRSCCRRRRTSRSRISRARCSSMRSARDPRCGRRDSS